MSVERDKEGRDAGKADPSDVESWEGLPLELEPPGGAALQGEETISRPIAELAAPGPPLAASPFLARWMLFCAACALAFSLVAIALSMLDRSGAVQWQGGLLALDCAVVVLLLRGYLARGAPARTVCHWVLGLSGLAASAFVIQAALLRSAVRFIYWPPTPEVLTALFASGLLGLAGTIVFAECLRGRSWACRSAAAASVAFLVLVLLQAFGPGGILSRASSLWGDLPSTFWLGLGGVTLGAAAFVLGREGLRAGRRARAWQAVAGGGLLALAVGAALAGRALGGAAGGASGAHRAWLAAAVCEAAALLPLALPGVVVAWRRHEPLRKDVLAATQFLWVLVALGVVAMVGVWLPTHLSVDLLHMGLVGAGVSAMVTGAWLGAKRGDWAGRWVLMPTGAVTIVVLCTLGELRASTSRIYPAESSLWSAAVMLSWSSLAVGLVFATAGLAVKRHQARERVHGRLLWPDARLMSALGAAVSTAALSVLFALWAGAPSVAASVRAALAGLYALTGDLLVLTGGAALRAWAGGATAAVVRACSGHACSATAAGLLAVVLAVHVAALSRARWAMHAVAVVWSVPLAGVSALAALYAVRLLLPGGEPGLATPAGRYLASSLGARIMLLGLAAAILVRLWECLRAALELSRQAAVVVPARAGTPAAPQEQDLAFLVRTGLLVGSLGLGAAMVLFRGRALEAMLSQLGIMAAAWLRAATVLTSGVGSLAAEWVGYAAAVAVIAVVVIAVHDEALHGRVAVYPLLALVWTLMVGVLGLGWGLQVRATSLPATPGRLPALAVTGVVLLLLAIATLTVWVRWWRLRRGATEAGEELMDSGDRIGAAHSLGSFGLLLVLAASAAVTYSALKSSPAFSPSLERLVQAAQSVRDWLALEVETARTHLTLSRSLGAAGAALAVASLAVLSLHLASRHRRGGVRMALFALWSGAALAGAGVGAYLLLQVPLGRWSGARILAAILLAVALLRAAVAIGAAGRWAGLGAQAPEG